MIWTARLVQLCDSAFPAGAYAFSDGLETLVQRGEVQDADGLQRFLAGQLQAGWGAQDAPAGALAWTGPDHDELDTLLDLLKVVRGPREASLRVGANLRRAAVRLWPERLEALPAARHQAVVYGLITRRLEVPQEAAVSGLVSSWLLGRAVSATRLMRLGGLDAQRVVTRLEPEVQRCVQAALRAGPDDLWGHAPGLDLAAAEQEGLEVRLFQS